MGRGTIFLFRGVRWRFISFNQWLGRQIFWRRWRWRGRRRGRSILWRGRRSNVFIFFEYFAVMIVTVEDRGVYGPVPAYLHHLVADLLGQETGGQAEEHHQAPD